MLAPADTAVVVGAAEAAPKATLYARPFTVITSPEGLVVTVYGVPLTETETGPLVGEVLAFATTKESDFTGPFALSLKNLGATFGNIA